MKLPVVEPADPADREPLPAYAYSYPHKSSYGPLTPPVPLAEAWRDEPSDQLSLYVHTPFCEMRCGFCNLFTRSQPTDALVAAYLSALERQFRAVREAVPQARFDRFAIGGGTPTLLSAAQLETLLAGVERTFDLSVRDMGTSVEASPATATADRLRALADFGVERVSLGVQSFVESEARSLGRPQRIDEVHRALAAIRAEDFPVLNIDLIYGGAEQTADSWRTSLEAALRYAPEELYLYPLYIRPQTGLARVGRGAAEHRSDLYRLARGLLREKGYVQTSLRGFRLPRNTAPSTYACQRDGMIGLGCGARSYTARLHYGSRFATTQAGVAEVLQEWIEQPDEAFSWARHGVRLNDEEQRRRFLVMSLLQAEGMALADYEARFGGRPQEDVPELALLAERGWLEEPPGRLALSEAGLERSDEVGPALYSQAVRARLREFVRL